MGREPRIISAEGMEMRSTRGAKSMWLAILVVLLLAATLAHPSTPAAAAARPDLIVKAVSTPSTSLTQGDTFMATVKVKNVGTGRAKGSSVGFYLSQDGTRGFDDVQIAGTRAVPALDPGASRKGQATLTIPLHAPVGAWRLVACADDANTIRESRERNNCKPAPSTVEIVEPVSSYDLIDNALQAGEVDAEKALTYKVFVDYEDPRLPAEYEGDDRKLTEGAAIHEAAVAFPTMSAEGQDVLKPFFVPPFHVGSWLWEQEEGTAATARSSTTDVEPIAATETTTDFCRALGETGTVWGDWDNIATGDGKARIWWQKSLAGGPADGDDLLAATLASELETTIWPKLVNLMGREPLADAGSTRPCRGIDDRLDIALLARSSHSAPAYLDPGCENTPSYILLNRNLASPDDLAHELMHAILWSYGVHTGCVYPGGYAWLNEATAAWAEDYVYPSGPPGGPPQPEHDYAPAFLTQPHKSLETNDRRGQYGSYLLPFFLVRGLGKLGVVRTMWENAANKDSLLAVDTAIGGFQTVWRQFTLYNWNRGEVDDYFVWDDLTAGALALPQETVGLPGTDIDVAVKHLAAQYRPYDFTKTVRKITYRNKFSSQDPAASVVAVVTYRDGSQEWRDLTGQSEVTFCRDKPSEDVSGLLLIFANGSMNTDLNGGEPSKLITKASCGVSPPAGWTGTFAGTKNRIDGVTESWTGDVSITGRRPDDTNPEWWFSYEDVAGTVTYTLSGTKNECKVRGGGTLTLVGGAGLNTYQARPDDPWYYSVALWSEGTITHESYDCANPGNNGQFEHNPFGKPELSTDAQPVAPGATVLSGTLVDELRAKEYAWHLTELIG